MKPEYTVRLRYNDTKGEYHEETNETCSLEDAQKLESSAREYVSKNNFQLISLEIISGE